MSLHYVDLPWQASNLKSLACSCSVPGDECPDSSLWTLPRAYSLMG